MKKGRHRRFEEARSLKRAIEVTVEPCPECGADPEDEHASWCLYESEELDELEELEACVPARSGPNRSTTGMPTERTIEPMGARRASAPRFHAVDHGCEPSGAEAEPCPAGGPSLEYEHEQVVDLLSGHGDDLVP